MGPNYMQDSEAEVKGISGAGMVEELENKYGFSPFLARRIVEVANEHGIKAEALSYGVVIVRYSPRTRLYTLEPPRTAAPKTAPENLPKRLSPVPKRRYTRGPRSTGTTSPRPSEGSMPRKSAAAAAAEVEEPEYADLSKAADKPITVTAQAFTEWIEEQTGYEADERSVSLAMSLRRSFQHDKTTRERIEDLREEREAAKPKAEPAPAPAKATRGRKAKAAPETEDEDEAEGEPEEALAAPAKRTRAPRGKAAATSSSSATSRPARGRGRAATKPAGAAAPF